MGSEARRGMARLMLRRPEWRLELQKRALQEARICALVEEYEAACAALEYWVHSPSLPALARAKEHRAFVAELEDDIVSLLRAKASRTP
jgi:hypothetical protein